MTATIRWIDGVHTLNCVVCGFGGDGTLVAAVERAGSATIEAVRCPQCASVTLIGEDPYDYMESDASIDSFIEGGISIDAALGLLTSTDTTQVTSFLDVGCNYGFAVDLAARVYGWDAMGAEPGSAGGRGAADLGIRIHRDYVREDTQLGRTFDLVLASEVVEHVPNPLGFLRGLKSQLSPSGRVLLTTPSAESVSTRSDDNDVLVAMSPGNHVFLASARGLEILLRAAGFESVTVMRSGHTLRAVASPRPGEALELTDTPADPIALERYLDGRFALAQRGSALASAMASRHFISLIHRGAFGEAVASRKRAIASVTQRSGIDLARPVRAIELIESGTAPTWNLASVAYACGIMALLDDREPATAVQYFELAIAAVQSWGLGSLIVDSSSDTLRTLATRELASALGALGSPRAHHALASLASIDSPEAAARASVNVFVSAIAGGHLPLARQLASQAALNAPLLAASTDPAEVTAGLNGLLGLTLLGLQGGSPVHALHWSSLALKVLESADQPQLSENHVAAIRDDLKRHHDLAESAIAASDEGGKRSHRPVEHEELSEPVQGAVSVILPVYNGATYLRTAIQSVVNQKVVPHELVVIDDGSVDDSASIVESLELPFPVVIIRQPNSGQSAARNAGGRAAQGEYLAFIDQDDEWRENHLDILLDAIESDSSLAWVFTDFDQVDADGLTITTHFVSETGVHHPKRSLVSTIAGDLMALPSASIMRRSAVYAVGGFDPRLSGYEDDDLFVRLFRAGWNHAFIPSSTVRYRVHASGSSSSPSFIRSRLYFMEKLLLTIPDDHRLNYFFSQDVIAPRFLNATLSDYSSALAARDYDRASEIVVALRSLSRLQGAVGLRRRMQLAALSHPRRTRTMLLIVERMPRFIRRRVNPALFFSQRSIVRAQRFHPQLPVA